MQVPIDGRQLAILCGVTKPRLEVIVLVEGQKWMYTENEQGTYLHLWKDGCKLSVSVGHSEDTLDDVVCSIIDFITRVERSKELLEG